MRIGTIGKSQVHEVASRIERFANKNHQDTLTSIRANKYTIRIDQNDRTYVKTVLQQDKNGVVQGGYSRLYKGVDKLRKRISNLFE